MKQLPEKFLKNMQTLLGEEFAMFLNSYKQSVFKGLRCNNNKINLEFLQNILNLKECKTIDFIPAIIINENTKFGNNPLHHAGLFYIQEPSAMLPPLCTKYKEDDIVLDLCASPGGKSGEIAERIPNGLLVSNEIITNRAIVLKENMIRMGYTNNIVTSTTPQNLEKLGAVFDKILVDAPCSGEGLFRKDENTINEWYDGINEKNSLRQLEILESASKLVKAGGEIIYSTCTFSKVENEDVIEKFLKEHQDFYLGEITTEVKALTTNGINNIGRRVYPHKNMGEGQYMALLVKKADIEYNTYKSKSCMRNLTNKEQVIVNNWIKTNMNNCNFNIKAYEDNICIIPPKEINTKGIFVLKYGTILGKIENDRLIPNHNVFVSYGNLFKQKLEYSLNDEDVQKYLKGESLEVDTNIKGYAVICVEGYALGGVKISNNRANNLYPKHLRI